MRTYLLVMSRTVSAEVIWPSVDIIRHHEQPISKSLRILLIRSLEAPGPCSASLSHHNVLMIVLPSAICVSAYGWLCDTHSRMEIRHFESAWGRAKPQESAEMPTCQMYNKFYICRIFTTILIPKRITTDNCKNSQIYKNVLSFDITGCHHHAISWYFILRYFVILIFLCPNYKSYAGFLMGICPLPCPCLLRPWWWW